MHDIGAQASRLRVARKLVVGIDKGKPRHLGKTVTQRRISSAG
jgi:hypothetical protein